ncbi:MAG: sodium:proton antiporter [Planctomycetes bacterium]|nr:sodium:proton antiporter [Planctomycetota bacterium]
MTLSKGAIPDESIEPEEIWISSFSVPKMDCPAEERTIRLALGGMDEVRGLSFDLAGRKLEVLHGGGGEAVLDRLSGLGLGASLEATLPVGSRPSTDFADSLSPSGRESNALRWLLGINALLFLVEMFAGILSESTALIGESLDNLADAAVYGLALYAVGHGPRMQLRAAHVAGVLQIALAIGVLGEVLRRLVYGSEPQSVVMMTIALVALTANVSCLLLISRHRGGGAHMKASWIFSANDVLINVGVIVAGALVAWTGSNLPDLVIGTATGLIVLNGARRILSIRE